MSQDTTAVTRNAVIVDVELPVAADIAYRYLSNPENLPHWAPNFARSVRREGDLWRVEMAEGEVLARFAPENDMGVLDHWVTMPDGAVIHNPMRVVPLGAGALLSFVVFRRPGWGQAELLRDSEMVRRDLEKLRGLVAEAAR